MPDQQGKLSREEYDEAVAWLNEKIKRAGRCQVCEGEPTLVLGNKIGNLLIASGGAYPVLVLICPTCGYFRLHGAMRAGIVKKEGQEGQKEETDGEDQNGTESS